MRNWGYGLGIRCHFGLRSSQGITRLAQCLSVLRLILLSVYITVARSLLLRTFMAPGHWEQTRSGEVHRSTEALWSGWRVGRTGLLPPFLREAMLLETSGILKFELNFNDNWHIATKKFILKTQCETLFNYANTDKFIKIMTRYSRTEKAPDQQLISAAAVKMWYIHIGLFPSFYLSLTALLLALILVIFICLVCFFLSWTTEWIRDITLKQERKLIVTESG